MLLLATDTSGKHGSIALVQVAAGETGADRNRSDGRRTAVEAKGYCAADVRVLEVVPLAGGTFSAQLVPQIAALLAKHGLTKNDIDALVVASGPGSFTGLRVGLAAIKALAEILGKPIAAVSLLEVVALSGAQEGRIAAALDAGRGEVYVGEYEVGGNSVQCLGERLLKREAFSAQVQAGVLITPDSALAEAARAAGLRAKIIAPLNAGEVARVGWHKILKGETVSPEQLEANYIRRSDAEEQLLAPGGQP